MVSLQIKGHLDQSNELLKAVWVAIQFLPIPRELITAVKFMATA